MSDPASSDLANWLSIDSTDIDVCKEQLATVGISQINAPLCADHAKALHEELSSARWSLNTLVRDQYSLASPEQIEAVGEERLTAFAQHGADESFRMVYDAIFFTNDEAPPPPPGSWSEQLLMQWSSPAALSIWNSLVEPAEVASLDMLASRYRAGHFLTPHFDGPNDARIAAFVLSLETGWKPHWGGQLHVDDNSGDTRVLTPQHNVLTIFAVPRHHFVSQVASYAPKGRISVTGWMLSG